MDHPSYCLTKGGTSGRDLRHFSLSFCSSGYPDHKPKQWPLNQKCMLLNWRKTLLASLSVLHCVSRLVLEIKMPAIFSICLPACSLYKSLLSGLSDIYCSRMFNFHAQKVTLAENVSWLAGLDSSIISGGQLRSQFWLDEFIDLHVSCW